MGGKNRPKGGSVRRSPNTEAFERALDAVEAHERPSAYPGLNAATRRAASRAQLLTFTRVYWPDWRYTKIRLYRRLLEERDAILVAERERFTAAGFDPETIVYQEVTNGLLASAASEFCQYAEDLAILVGAAGSDDFFARDLASQSAGRMQDDVKRWSTIDEASTARALRIPTHDAEWAHAEGGTSFGAALQLAAARLRSIATLYRAWQFHYLRYKHGLLLALRFGEAKASAEYLAGRRSNLSGFPVALDCASLGETLDATDFRGEGLVLPDFGATDVRCNAKHLARERNLLRVVFPPGTGETNIGVFEDHAAFVSQLQRVLLANRAAELDGKTGDVYYMPADNPAALIQVTRVDEPAST